MRYYCFIGFLVLLSANLFAQKKSLKNGDTIISWKPMVKIAWSDFQGETNPATFGKAKTSYKIEIIPSNVRVDEEDRIQNYEDLTTEARFYKRQSWTTVSVNDTIVLDHEQLHFDIAELFARKIRKGFVELQKNKESRFSSYSQLYNLYWKACRKYQMDYDFETNHGRDLELNKKWSSKVKLELENLNKYK